MNSLRASIFIFLFAASYSRTINASEATRVQLRDIPSHGHEYVGQRIATRGCLVDVTPHGLFMEPCGSRQWRQILGLEMSWDAFHKVVVGDSAGPVQGIEADVVGVLVEQPNERTPGTHFMLRVEEISHVQAHKP